MKCTLLGFKSVDFEDDNGNKISGVKIYYSYPDVSDDDLIGDMTDSKFINKKAFDSFPVTVKDLNDNLGCAFDIEFNPNKKVIGLCIA